MSIYVICPNSGKDFVDKRRDTFKYEEVGCNVIVLDDSKAAKRWAQEKELYGGARTVTKAEAQQHIDDNFAPDPILNAMFPETKRVL